jgi:hypothetical protein
MWASRMAGGSSSGPCTYSMAASACRRCWGTSTVANFSRIGNCTQRTTQQTPVTGQHDHGNGSRCKGKNRDEGSGSRMGGRLWCRFVRVVRGWSSGGGARGCWWGGNRPSAGPGRTATFPHQDVQGPAQHLAVQTVPKVLTQVGHRGQGGVHNQPVGTAPHGTATHSTAYVHTQTSSNAPSGDASQLEGLPLDLVSAQAQQQR